MTQFILLFAAMLFLSAIAINGFYNITRGDWYKNADGTKYWDGKIFSFWSKFLQQHTIKYETYSGDEYLKQFDKLKDFFNPNSEILDFGVNAVVIRKLEPKKASLFFTYALSKGLLINIEPYAGEKGDKDLMMVGIYKEIKEYKLPNWVRAPLGECITCLSSVFGTLAWMFWYQIAKQVQYIYPTEVGAAFIGMPLISKIGLWIFFCFSLAWANEIIFNVNHKLKQ